MTRTLRALLSATALATVTLATVAAPAHADGGFLVLYTDSLFKGDPLVYWQSDPAMSYWSSDKASSVRNHDSVAWVLFDDKQYRDRRFCIRPGKEMAYLGAEAYRFNDKISSVRRMPTADCEGHPEFWYPS
jgi:hypothetical protein